MQTHADKKTSQRAPVAVGQTSSHQNNSIQLQQLRQFQKIAGNSRHVQQLKAMQARMTGHVSNSAVAQRRVFIGANEMTPVNGQRSHNALLNGVKKTLDSRDKGLGFVKDEYIRKYNDEAEFNDHSKSRPVEVGLARKMGRWYRLPELKSNKEFFVLGESHGTFGYRELVAESNLSGKVLGEGGTRDILSATGNAKIEMNESADALKERNGTSREGKMETTFAKNYYALAELKVGLEAMIGNRGVMPASTRNMQAESAWLGDYKAAADRGEDAGSKLPFYKHHGEKYYATTGSAAENYDVVATAKSLLTKLNTAIVTYLTKHKNKAAAYAGTLVDAMLNELTRTDTLVDADEKVKGLKNAIVLIDKLSYVMEYLSKKEAKEQEFPTDGTTMGERVTAVNNAAFAARWSDDRKKAFAYRDFSMFKAVVKAKNDGDYIMAGMGDWHAQNLKTALQAEHIKVLTLNDFFAKTTNAIV